MRRIFFLFVLVLLGCGEQSYTGKLSLNQDSMEVKLENGDSRTLSTGRFQVTQSGKRLTILSLEEDATEAMIKLPNRRPVLNQNGSIEYSAEEISQEFSIIGQSKYNKIRTWEKEGSASCTYSGFCMACGMDFQGEFSCGFRFHTNCSGSRNVLREFQEFDAWYEIDFYEQSSDRYLGKFSSDAIRSTSSRIIDYLSSCN